MTHRWTLMLSVTALTIVAIGLVVGLIVPTVRTIIGIRNATVAEFEALERRYRQGRILTRVLRDYALISDEVNALRASVPSERDVLRIVRTIEQIAANHRLVESVAIERNAARTVGADIARIPITLEIAGSYPAIVSALHDLERLPVPPIIETITLTTIGVPSTNPSGSPTRVQLVVRGAITWRADVRAGAPEPPSRARTSSR